MQGTSFASAWSATAFVVSGAPELTNKSTLSLRINSEATSEARVVFDWLSLLMI
jgi:hypothetical protein